MNELEKIETLAPLNLERSLKTLSLPAWLQRSANGLTAGSEQVTREDGVKAQRVIPTITRSLAPSPSACLLVEARIADLRLAREAIDIDIAMAKVTELLLSFASQAMNESGAKARARGYITALEDLPAWAIAEACRKWLRGEAGEQNYNFAPSPPVLRRVTEGIVSQVENQIAVLERLLSAKIIEDPEEFSAEHCEEMRGRLAAVFREVGKQKPMPKPTAAEPPTADELADLYPKPAKQEPGEAA